MTSTVAWMALLRPTFFSRNAAALAVWLCIGAAALLVTWIRLGRLGNLHLYSARAAGVVGYASALAPSGPVRR